ncbi:hypothetical protein Tco_0980676, partial [Tanacetum coccineum]
MDLTLASESRLMQLNELAELRDGAYKNTRIYKERTKKWHDSRLHGDKDFKVGDKDLVNEISTNIGGEFTNLEILKCWSLKTSRRLFNTNYCSIKLHGDSLPNKYQGTFYWVSEVSTTYLDLSRLATTLNTLERSIIYKLATLYLRRTTGPAGQQAKRVRMEQQKPCGPEETGPVKDDGLEVQLGLNRTENTHTPYWAEIGEVV